MSVFAMERALRFEHSADDCPVDRFIGHRFVNVFVTTLKTQIGTNGMAAIEDVELLFDACGKVVDPFKRRKDFEFSFELESVEEQVAGCVSRDHYFPRSVEFL